MRQLGLSPSAFLAHMLVPGLGAAALCTGTVALRDWRALRAGYATPALNFDSRCQYSERQAAFAPRCCRTGRVAGTAPRTPRPGGRSPASSQSRFFSGANGHSSRSRGELARRSRGSWSRSRRASPCTLPRSQRNTLPALLGIAIGIGAASGACQQPPRQRLHNSPPRSRSQRLRRLDRARRRRPRNPARLRRHADRCGPGRGRRTTPTPQPLSPHSHLRVCSLLHCFSPGRDSEPDAFRRTSRNRPPTRADTMFKRSDHYSYSHMEGHLIGLPHRLLRRANVQPPKTTSWGQVLGTGSGQLRVTRGPSRTSRKG